MANDSSPDSEKWQVSGENVDAKASAEKSADSWHNTQRPQSICPSGSIGVLIKNNLKMKAPCFFNYFYWILFSGVRLDIDI